MGRPTKDAYFIQMARLVATRSTCLRRSVGCVLVNARGHVLSTGYNGVAAGQPHCNEQTGYVDELGAVWHPHNHLVERYDPAQIRDRLLYEHACPGATAASGANLDGCEAVHAEMNGVTQCRDVWAIDVCYVTASPCVTCTKLLMSTSCRRIVFIEEYAHNEIAKQLWTYNSTRLWEMMSV